MSNHLAKYYTNLFFIVILAFGTVVVSLLSSFTEMLELYDTTYRIDILLCGFNGVMIMAILKSWRCIDQEMKRRLSHSPLNQIEKEWMEKNSHLLLLIKNPQQQTKPVCYSKTSRIKINGLLAIVLLANIISFWVNI
ncbi:hypothetical protein [Bacillus benzoevorans]|uniref:Uncharacterized protein n=1 Tax=Bacillus benzoevorans TaxID=1456 RepID=A0A7X0HUJ7_9BACI|nr:hypothetical protein [Bacillus benzoevorans]MBB6447098.1 hypothetical protein [Bacillus benzoevorans]